MEHNEVMLKTNEDSRGTLLGPLQLGNHFLGREISSWADTWLHLGWKLLVIQDGRGACADQVIAAGFDAGSKLCIW